MKAWDIRGGLAGRILRVDLTAGRVWTEDTLDHARQFLGGRAVNSRILLDELSPNTECRPIRRTC